MSKTKGLLRILRSDHKGLINWAYELKKRGIPANFNANEVMIEKDSKLIKEISNLGFKFGASYDGSPFWYESYESQLNKIIKLKDKIEEITGNPISSFSSKFSSYNEETLKIAEKLGIKYIFARGTSGIRSMVYKPLEYNVKIISTSDFYIENMGGGTLADGSFWARGLGFEDFKTALFNIKNYKVDRITLVAQAQLSGRKVNWWNVYMEFFDADFVKWVSIEDYAIEYVEMPNILIPVNTEISYEKPRPKIPLDEEKDIPELEKSIFKPQEV